MGFTDVLRKSFPFITAAASMGGPLGVMAANVVGKAIGADKAPAGTADGISNAIATALANPEQRAALLKAEQDFQLQMAELGYKDAEELEATAEADRASARNREIATQDKFPKYFAALITLGFFALIFLAGIRGFGEQSRDLTNIMIGTLASSFAAVVSYYFGSSAGSAKKTELLAQAQPIQK
jgi:hypothetical protein